MPLVFEGFGRSNWRCILCSLCLTWILPPLPHCCIGWEVLCKYLYHVLMDFLGCHIFFFFFLQNILWLPDFLYSPFLDLLHTSCFSVGASPAQKLGQSSEWDFWIVCVYDWPPFLPAWRVMWFGHRVWVRVMVIFRWLYSIDTTLKDE